MTRSLGNTRHWHGVVEMRTGRFAVSPECESVEEAQNWIGRTRAEYGGAAMADWVTRDGFEDAPVLARRKT